jgi:hypothetical protein
VTASTSIFVFALPRMCRRYRIEGPLMARMNGEAPLFGETSCRKRVSPEM